MASTMRRVEYSAYGGREVLKLATGVAVPQPKEGQVLVKVAAASLNPVDYKIRSGAVRILVSVDFPNGIGFDLSGEVVALGAGVTDFAVGDRVMARSKTQNSVAEYAVVDVAVVTKMPAQMDFVQAAALPLAGQTALQALRRGELKEGQSVLVCGGAGGVGTFAVQLARHVFKAGRVVATGSPKKFDLLKELGAHECVDYHDAKAADALAAQFDLVFDCAGDVARWAKASKPGRLVVSVAATPDPEGLQRAGFQPNFFVRTLLWLLSMKERHAASAAKAQYDYLWLKPNAADLAELGGYVAEGKMKCVVDTTVQGLDKFQEAFERLETGRATGKVVISIS